MNKLLAWLLLTGGLLLVYSAYKGVSPLDILKKDL